MQQLLKEPLVFELAIHTLSANVDTSARACGDLNLHTLVVSDIGEQLDEQIGAAACDVHQRTFLSEPHARGYCKHLYTPLVMHVGRDDFGRAQLTSPIDFVVSVRVPKNLLMTKPPRTVLISGIPLCLA